MRQAQKYTDNLNKLAGYLPRKSNLKEAQSYLSFKYSYLMRLAAILKTLGRVSKVSNKYVCHNSEPVTTKEVEALSRQYPELFGYWHKPKPQKEKPMPFKNYQAFYPSEYPLLKEANQLLTERAELKSKIKDMETHMEMQQLRLKELEKKIEEKLVGKATNNLVEHSE